MESSRRRIGFVDHVLDNWHANVFLDLLRKSLQFRGFEVTACTASDATAGQAWGSKNNVPYFNSPGEMAGNVDAFMILAPSNPERHLEMCRQVFPLKKPTYIDKTFAPNFTVAREIFALADQHGLPIQSSSSLRHTNVQLEAQKMGKVEQMVAWGAGRSFGEYAVHVVEMIVSCMGSDVQSVMRRGTDRLSQLMINYPDGRTAVGNIYCETETPFSASLTDARRTVYVPVGVSTLYANALTAILDFFETGKPNVPREQTLIISRILEIAESAQAREGFVRLV